MPKSGGCCQWCTSFIITLGLTALFMWLSLRPSKPSFSVSIFNFTAINENTSSIFFQVKIKNKNKDKGVFYDPLNFTLYYDEDRKASPNITHYYDPNRNFSLGKITIPGFRQGHKKTAERNNNITTKGVLIKPNETAVFLVDVATKVRYKIMFWKTNHHKIKASKMVEVEGTGPGTGKLKSGAEKSIGTQVCLRFLILFVLFLLW